MTPISELGIWGEIHEAPRLSPDGLKTILATQTIDLALGEEYPSSVSVTLRNLVHRLIAPCLPRGTIALTSIEGEGAISASLLDGTSLVLDATDEGQTEFNLRGAYTPSADGEPEACGDFFDSDEPVAVEITLTVRARRPAEVLFTRRDCPDLLVGGSTLEKIMPRVTLLDGDGEQIRAQNVGSVTPVDLTITAPEGAFLGSEEQGAASIRLARAEGVVRIEARGGESVEFEVLATTRIDGLTIEFQMPGVAGTALHLESGGHYGQDGWGRKGRQIAPMLTAGFQVDGETVCVTPSVEWFELSSATPDTCVAREPAIGLLGPDDSFNYLYEGVFTGHAADVLADGLCELTLTAPRFNGGSGISHFIGVTLDNVDQLQYIP
jgi:hypothetical protein